MDNNNLSFFDMFGDAGAAYKPVETKKPETKKDVKKEPKKGNVRTYKLPLKIVTGVFPDFSVKEEDLGKNTITEAKLHEIIANKYEQFSKALTQLDVKGLLCKVYNKTYAQFLGSQKKIIDDGWRITLNGFSLPLPEGLEIDQETIKSMWEKQYPAFSGLKVSYLYDPEGKVIVPLIESDKLDEEISLPATYFMFGQEEHVLEGSGSSEIEEIEPVSVKEVERSEEDDDSEGDSDDNSDEDAANDSDEEASDENDSEEVSDENSDDDDSDDDDSDDKPAVANQKRAKKLTVNDLRKILSEANSGMTFAVSKCQDGKYMVYPSSAYVQTSAQSGTTPKKELYPTVDTQIGLIFTKIKLSPELFSGKEAVDKKDLCKFLAKDYEEYADSERVTIIYDEKRRLIKPMLSAARKGCVDKIVSSKEEVDELLAREGYQLINYSEDSKHLWRIEKTPIGTFKMLWGTNNFIGNSFEFALPKVPEQVWRKIIYLFKSYAKKGLEVCCQLYYREGKGYGVYIPQQLVGPAYVHFNPAPLMNYCISHDETYLVADFHSHHSMPAFFSTIDDGDEKRTGLFGVFGAYDYETKKYDFMLRAGSQGMYASLDIADFFENWENRYNMCQAVPFFIEDEEARIVTDFARIAK